MNVKLKKTNIGGQALFEGILMKGPYNTSIVIRKKNGEIETRIVDRIEISKKYKIFNYPFFRGIGALYDAILNGTKAIDYSVSFFEEENTNKSDTRKKLENHFYNVLSFLMIIAFIIIFFYGPTWFSNLFRKEIKSIVILNIIEGIVRVALFLVYILSISRLKDIKRVFEYHGAEHKTISCYEHGEELTVENVKKYSKLHPRCGTSFMFNMVIISALILSFFGWPNPIIRFLTRILVIPILVGVTYELNRWMGKSDSLLSNLLSKPGMFVQHIGTVREPKDDMIEVAIEAMKLVIPEDEHADEW